APRHRARRDALVRRDRKECKIEKPNKGAAVKVKRTRLGVGTAVVAVVIATAVQSSGATGAAARASNLRVREWNPPTSASTRARFAAGAPSVPMWSHTYNAG